MEDLTAEQLNRLISTHVRDVLDSYDHALLQLPAQENWTDGLDAIESLKLAHTSTEDLHNRSYSKVYHVADLLLKGMELQLDRESQGYKRLCRELLRVNGFLESAWVSKLEGNEDKPLDLVFAEAMSLVHLPPGSMPAINRSMPIALSSPPPKGPTLTDAANVYIKEKMDKTEWTTHTLKDDEPKIRLFVELCGISDDATESVPLPASALGIDEVRRYSAALYKLPSNWKKKPEYRSKPLPQLLKMDIPAEDRISKTTILNHFTKVKSFILWMKQNKYIEDADIRAILRVRQEKQDHEYRDLWTKDELEKLFNEDYVTETEGKAWKFWVPLLGLYTGARLEELCQLRLDDIQEAGGVWCLAIREGEDQKLKTLAACRFVPLHRFLIDELHFLDFVGTLKARRHVLLFPDLRRGTEDAKKGKNVSRWFAAHRKRRGLTKGLTAKKDFHSFRCNLAHWCEANRVAESTAAKLIGHKHKGITYDRYAGRTEQQILFEDIISKLDYGIDLSHLSTSEWCRP